MLWLTYFNKTSFWFSVRGERLHAKYLMKHTEDRNGKYNMEQSSFILNESFLLMCIFCCIF